MATDLRPERTTHRDAPDSPDAASRRVATVPNVLSAIRFVGAFVIVGLALAERNSWLLPTMAGLMLTDWLDGKIAVRFHQQTVFGARLDSLADVSFYSAALFAMAWLRFDLVWVEWAWLIPGMAAYLVNALLGWIRFGQLPAYHTFGAKAGWLLASLAIFGVLALGKGWPLRAAGAWVLLVNLEAILITLVLPSGAVDVHSLWHALQRRRAAIDPREPS